MKKVFLFAAMAVLALVGCEKQTQTSLDYTDAPNEAKISGQLGFYYAEPGGETQFIGLKGQKIWFEVNASEYDTEAPAKAKKVFEAVTSSVDSIAGNFEITVPLGVTRIQGDVRTDMIRIEYKGKMFYFKEIGAGEMNISLISGNNEIKRVIAEKDPVLSECVGEGLIKGRFVREAGTSKVGGAEESGEVPAEGFTVVAHITYDKKVAADASLVKEYVTTTNANGEYSFSIPAYDDGNKAEIEVKQKAAKIREFKNNEWVETDYYFDYAKTAISDVKVQETVLVGTKSLKKGTAVENNDKAGNIKVSGYVYREIIATTEDNNHHVNGIEVSKTPYECDVVIELANATEGKSLFYKATSDKKGFYEAEGLQIYKDWDYSNVKIKVYVQGVIPWVYEKGVCPGFENFYLGYVTKAESGVDYYFAKVDKWYGKITSVITTDQDLYSSEIINGTYNDMEMDGTKKVWRSVSKDASAYFPHEMADLILQFKYEDVNKVKGIQVNSVDVPVNHEDLIKYDDRSTQTVTNDVLVYSDGINIEEK